MNDEKQKLDLNRAYSQLLYAIKVLLDNIGAGIESGRNRLARGLFDRKIQPDFPRETGSWICKRCDELTCSPLRNIKKI